MGDAHYLSSQEGGLHPACRLPHSPCLRELPRKLLHRSRAAAPPLFAGSVRPKSFCLYNKKRIIMDLISFVNVLQRSVSKVNQVIQLHAMKGRDKAENNSNTFYKVWNHIFGFSLLFLVFLLPIRNISPFGLSELCGDLQFVRKALSEPFQGLHYMVSCLSRLWLV